MMKTILSLISLALTTPCFAQYIIVSDPVVVSDQENNGNLRPRVVENASSDPVIVWSDNATHKVYATHLMGNTFMNPVQLNPEGTMAAVYDWSGPEIAANGNDIYVVYKELPESSGDIYLVHSANGGMSWGSPLLVSSSESIAARMPSVAAGSDGEVYVAYMLENYDTMATEWVLVKSEDEGQTFSAEVSATNAIVETVCDCCPADLLVHQNYVAILYRNNDENLRDIRGAVSSDGGETFDVFIDFDPLDWEIDACPASGPRGVIDGFEIYSIWMSDATGESRVYHSQHGFGPGSAVNTIEIHPTTENETQNYPSLAREYSYGYGLVAWEVNDSGQKDIALSWTASNFSLNEYMVITSDDSGHQQRPELAGTGPLYHLVYSDNGGDALIYRTVDISNSVQDFDHSPQLTVYPNPTIDEVYVDILFSNTNDISYRICDLQSRPVRSVKPFTSTGPLRISFEDLASGVYVLELRTGNKVSRVQVVRG